MRAVNQQGFTLIEMMIAMGIWAVLIAAAGRFLSALTVSNRQQTLLAQLHEDVYHTAFTLEKVIRRAGYCRGNCRGAGLRIENGGQHCLLVRWDQNSNGRWEPPSSPHSDYYGYRLRGGNLETQRGVASCTGAGWEKINDPDSTRVTAFRLQQRGRQVRLFLEMQALRWPMLKVSVQRRVTKENDDGTARQRRAWDGRHDDDDSVADSAN